MAKKKLLIVLPQNDLLKSEGTMYIGQEAEGLITRMAEYIKNFKGDRVFILDEHERNSVEFGLTQPHCIVGTWGCNIVDEISKLDMDEKDGKIIITRKKAFAPMSLGEMKLEGKDDEFHVCGVDLSTDIHDMIVFLNTVFITQGNFLPKIVIHEDLVGGKNSDFGQRTLERLRAIYLNIQLNTEER